MEQDSNNLRMPLGDHIDQLVAQMTSSWSQKGSRRDFLMRFGKVTLALVGSAVANSLPTDRRVASADHGSGCTDWKWCYMSGKPCACCGGSNTSCPYSGCVKTGISWTGCCIEPGGCGKIIDYQDCCASGPEYCPSVSCSCLCHNAGTQDWWCTGGTEMNYRCTLARVIGSCPC